MIPLRPRHCAVLAIVAGLAECGSESDRNIAGTITASRWSTFSEWSEPVSLGAPINTTLNEQQPTPSKDGLTMFFASSRVGTLGGLDVWVSHRADLAHRGANPSPLAHR